MSVAAPALPDRQAALNNVFEGVHQRVFFNKLASFGYAPTNAQEAQSLLALAGRCDLMAQDDAVKTAAASNDPFGAALASLDHVLGESGHPGFQKQAEQNELWAAQQTALELMDNNDLYNSMLVVKQAEAEQYAQQIQQQQGV